MSDFDAGDARLPTQEVYEGLDGDVAQFDQYFDEFTAFFLLKFQCLGEHIRGDHVLFDEEVANAFWFGGIGSCSAQLDLQ